MKIVGWLNFFVLLALIISCHSLEKWDAPVEAAAAAGASGSSSSSSSSCSGGICVKVVAKWYLDNTVTNEYTCDDNPFTTTGQTCTLSIPEEILHFSQLDVKVYGDLATYCTGTIRWYPFYWQTANTASYIAYDDDPNDPTYIDCSDTTGSNYAKCFNGPATDLASFSTYVGRSIYEYKDYGDYHDLTEITWPTIEAAINKGGIGWTPTNRWASNENIGSVCDADVVGGPQTGSYASNCVDAYADRINDITGAAIKNNNLIDCHDTLNEIQISVQIDILDDDGAVDGIEDFRL